MLSGEPKERKLIKRRQDGTKKKSPACVELKRQIFNRTETGKTLLQVENNTDMQTDYFEKDRIRIPPSSEFFKTVEGYANVT